MASPRLTVESVKILKFFLSTEQRAHGLEVLRSTGLAGGTGYPILRRLEGAGYLNSRWERGDPQKLQRPLRRYYSITNSGKDAAHAVLSALTVTQ